MSKANWVPVVRMLLRSASVRRAAHEFGMSEQLHTAHTACQTGCVNDSARIRRHSRPDLHLVPCALPVGERYASIHMRKRLRRPSPG